MYCVEESTCDNVGTFRRPPQSFGAPTVIWRPENYAPLPSSLRRSSPDLHELYKHSQPSRGGCHICELQDQPLTFSDGLVLLASPQQGLNRVNNRVNRSQQGLQRALDQFSAACDQVRMKISTKTTEVLRLCTNQRQYMLQASGIHCSRWRNSST